MRCVRVNLGGLAEIRVTGCQRMTDVGALGCHRDVMLIGENAQSYVWRSGNLLNPSSNLAQEPGIVKYCFRAMN